MATAVGLSIRKCSRTVLSRVEQSRCQLPRVGGKYPVVAGARSYSTKKQSKLWRQRPNKEPRLSIILTEDVPNLGVKGQIVKVKHGYGRNHLLPHKVAVYATPNNITKFNAFEVEKESSSSVFLNDRIVDYLNEKTLTVEHDPNDESAIFEQHISKAFQNSLQLDVPLDCIELEEPITDFESEHSVGVRVDDETVVMVPVVVERTLNKRRQRKVDKIVKFSQVVESRAEEEEEES